MAIGEWQPLWLEDGRRQLYAALHPAAHSTHSMGVLFVPPLLHEQPRSRRFIAETASAFAALGLPGIRFDFSGTGDSNGDAGSIDFASMHEDLDLALSVMKSRAGVERVALLAWRGAAFPVSTWLACRRHVDLLVLWEPIYDGAGWLAELEVADAVERGERPGWRPGVPRRDTLDDGQLMGCPAPERLRRDMAGTRVSDAGWDRGMPVWAVLRGGDVKPEIRIDRVLSVPAEAPTFNAGDMEAPFFMLPLLEQVVDRLGRALLERRALRESICQ